VEGKSVLKVPGGKLLKVFLEYDDKIDNVKITGDFFFHPEESLEKLEKEMIGSEMDKDKLLDKINGFIEKYGIKLFGLESKDIVEGILKCKNSDY